MSATCPAGHASTTDDYCDTCGIAMGGAAPATPEPTLCPGCGEPVSARYCESCGYDVEAGTPAPTITATLEVGADHAHWERMVGGAGEPAFPAELPSQTFTLAGDRQVLGRVRSGAPVDVDLALQGANADPAVSHEQCVFTKADDIWSVSDAGSSNGTYVNDATEPLAAGASHALADGDRILVGAWTVLTFTLVTA